MKPEVNVLDLQNVKFKNEEFVVIEAEDGVEAITGDKVSVEAYKIENAHLAVIADKQVSEINLDTVNVMTTATKDISVSASMSMVDMGVQDENSLPDASDDYFYVNELSMDANSNHGNSAVSIFAVGSTGGNDEAVIDNVNITLKSAGQDSTSVAFLTVGNDGGDMSANIGNEDASIQLMLNAQDGGSVTTGFVVEGVADINGNNHINIGKTSAEVSIDGNDGAAGILNLTTTANGVDTIFLDDYSANFTVTGNNNSGNYLTVISTGGGGDLIALGDIALSANVDGIDNILVFQLSINAGDGDDNVSLGNLNIDDALNAITIITGGEGNDVLTLAQGSVVLAGGIGADDVGAMGVNDTFVFAGTENFDHTITDFEAAGNAAVVYDVIDLSAFAELSSIDDLLLNQVDADTLINLGDDTMLTLLGVDANTLTSDNFVFAA